MAPLLVLAAALGGCSSPNSATSLFPDGPPKILQVFVQERITFTDVDGKTKTRTSMQLAYGDHPDIPTEPVGGDNPSDPDDRVVTNAEARSTQRIRVVVDELLDGSSLEQIACADGTFSDIPSGTNPDDVADCSGSDLSKCTAVCIGAAGPIGILDEDDDGAADAFRFKEGAAKVVCADTEIPLDLEKSFYNPSGNQLIPADPDLKYNGLGPAVVLTPLGLRTGSQCTIVFDPSVTDKDGNQVCAPTPCAQVLGCDFEDQPCTPGDTSAVSFGVQPFRLLGSDPDDGQTGVALTSSEILLQFNADLDPDTLTAITVNDGTSDVPVTYALESDDPTIVTVTDTDGFQPLTTYTVHVSSGATGVTDVFGGQLAEDISFSFTTRDAAANPPDAAVPDAGAAADAGTPDAAP